MLRMDGQPKERKPVQNASNKISQVVRQVLVPMLTAPIGSYISFRAGDPSRVGRELLERLRETEPDTVRDRGAFVARMSSLYDSVFTSGQTGGQTSGQTGMSEGLHEPPDVLAALHEGLVQPAVREGLVEVGCHVEGAADGREQVPAGLDLASALRGCS